MRAAKQYLQMLWNLAADLARAISGQDMVRLEAERQGEDVPTADTVKHALEHRYSSGRGRCC